MDKKNLLGKIDKTFVPVINSFLKIMRKMAKESLSEVERFQRNESPTYETNELENNLRNAIVWIDEMHEQVNNKGKQ